MITSEPHINSRLGAANFELPISTGICTLLYLTATMTILNIPISEGREICEGDAKGRFPRGPKSQVTSHLRSIRAISAVESIEVGKYNFTRGSKSCVPSMTTWMSTWQHFLERRLGGLCWELGQAKSQTQLSKQVPWIFLWFFEAQELPACWDLLAWVGT
jgi:hypothetical protein